MGDRFYWIGIQQSSSNFVIAQNQVNLPKFLAKSVEPISRQLLQLSNQENVACLIVTNIMMGVYFCRETRIQKMK